MSRMDPGQNWNIYNLHFHHYYSTYNTALKAAKTVLEGEVARTEVETDYDQPRKRKKNMKYVSSSEDEEVDNSSSKVPRGASSSVPAPDSGLQNKLKVLLKTKSVKASAICHQKNTHIGKLFSRNESHVTHDTTLDKNPNDSLLNKSMSIYVCDLFKCL
ncbi:PREDICTED: uncharacterized protein LOC105450913 [Wasmannia auropunctata]|uniref:uncharacterized protein LOC105450913 n=1 Tax=Wasmannia auropunctata TaxID=64793 RepID=UPI0005EEF0A5|nr:PREDICTED: uncharacterized protein LOC105450913 [Wasmannia auropunctata]